jgi:hypothetical protein
VGIPASQPATAVDLEASLARLGHPVLDGVEVTVDDLHPSALDRQRGTAVHQAAPDAGLGNVAFERELAEVGSVQRPSVVEEVGRLSPGRRRPGRILASRPRHGHGARDPNQALDEVGHKRKLAR